jgi:EmrB/QacA subfamily drug resistance transporter
MNTVDLDLVHRRRWWSLAVLCVGLYLVVSASSIVNVALPTIQQDLSASGSELQWIVDGFVMAFAGLLLVAGNLGDKFGRKGALVTGLTTMAAGSVLASFADTSGLLIAAQAVIGVGAAFVMPTTLGLLTNIFPAHERSKAIAIWAGVAGVAVAGGPLSGGLLLDHFWWGSIFLLNVVLAAGAIAATVWLVPTSRDVDAPPVDRLGALLSIAGLVTLLYGIIEGPAKGWTDAMVLGGFAAGAVLLTSFVAWERHTPTPMLHIAFYRNPRFTTASVAIALLYFAQFGIMFLATQYLQHFLGYDALQAGVRFLPLAAGIIVATPLSSRFVRRLGTKVTVTTGLLLAAIGMAILLTTDTSSGYGVIAVAFVIAGMGLGFTISPATDAIMGSVPAKQGSAGSAMNDTTRQVGGALGVAVLGSVLSSAFGASVDDRVTAGLPAEAADLAQDSLGGALAVANRLPGPRGQALIDAARDGFIDGVHRAAVVGVVVLLVGAVLTWRFLPARSEAEAVEDVSLGGEPTVDAAGADSAEEVTAAV